MHKKIKQRQKLINYAQVRVTDILNQPTNQPIKIYQLNKIYYVNVFFGCFFIHLYQTYDL